MMGRRKGKLLFCRFPPLHKTPASYDLRIMVGNLVKSYVLSKCEYLLLERFSIENVDLLQVADIFL